MGEKDWNNVNLVYQLHDLNFGKILACIVRNRSKGIVLLRDGREGINLVLLKGCSREDGNPFYFIVTWSIV